MTNRPLLYKKIMLHLSRTNGLKVVTNGSIHRRYLELSNQHPSEQELDIRRRVQLEFPRFKVTDIRDRINTWNLIEEFRAEYGDEDNGDDLEARINKSFQYFRQANDTFRNKNIFSEPEFKELCFMGYRKNCSQVLLPYVGLTKYMGTNKLKMFSWGVRGCEVPHSGQISTGLLPQRVWKM